MKKIDPYYYIELGQNIKSVAALSDSTRNFDAFMALLRLNKSLEVLANNKLLFTKSIETPIEKVLESISGTLVYLNKLLENSDQDDRPPATFQALQVRLKDLQTALIQGLPLLNLYSASPQGTHNLDLLIDSAAQSTFGDYIPAIAPQVVQDFDESGKCLAFALYTAAGYHAARACEGMLRSYAEEFLNAKKIEKLETMGAIIHKLKEVKGDAQPDVRIIDRADRVREYDRNVLMHPGQFLSDFDARSAFAIAGELVNMIAARKHQLGIIKALAAPPVSTSAIPPTPGDET